MQCNNPTNYKKRNTYQLSSDKWIDFTIFCRNLSFLLQLHCFIYGIIFLLCQKYRISTLPKVLYFYAAKSIVLLRSQKYCTSTQPKVLYFYAAKSIVLLRSQKYRTSTQPKVSYFYAAKSIVFLRSQKYRISTQPKVSYFYAAKSIVLLRSQKFVFTTTANSHGMPDYVDGKKSFMYYSRGKLLKL